MAMQIDFNMIVSTFLLLLFICWVVKQNQMRTTALIKTTQASDIPYTTETEERKNIQSHATPTQFTLTLDNLPELQSIEVYEILHILHSHTET